MNVEMRYQPERALTLRSPTLGSQPLSSRNEISAREGIDTSTVHDQICTAYTRRNEISAREGIDTPLSSALTAPNIKVEMRYQPERALTQ